MAFLFFRKKEETVAPVRQPVMPAAPAKPAATDFEVMPAHTVASIEVSGSDSGISPVAEEAAILYANGRADAAIETLLQGLTETGGLQQNLDAWFMLFDLFQVEGRKEDFDKLAVDFSVQFERSAPSWVDPEAGPGSGVPEALRTGGGRYFGLTGTLSGASQAQIEEMMKASRKEGAFRIDFGKLQALEPDGCKLLLEALQTFRREHKELVLSGTAELERLLQKDIDEGPGAAPNQSCWLLLLELCQLQGRQEEFENLSVDYAVAYEVSPPSWELLTAQVAQEEAGAEAPPPAPAGEVPADAFALSGTITGSSLPQLPELSAHAESRKEVVIDMRRARRVDFVAAGVLLNAFTGLKRAGKRVIILGANEMIIALFTVVGLNQFAIILKNKQH
ncbi:MAG: STAS domain-containing protein [Betaproteobacteria bacterium]|nr:STAS domain-containing protein [Betaproteobacteria bacterium]